MGVLNEKRCKIFKFEFENRTVNIYVLEKVELGSYDGFGAVNEKKVKKVSETISDTEFPIIENTLKLLFEEYNTTNEVQEVTEIISENEGGKSKYETKTKKRKIKTKNKKGTRKHKK
jgi:hypothetical protein